MLLAAGGALAVVALSATPALAHVSVSSPDAQSGGFGKLVFRVPNESETAGTVKLSVQLPTTTPFAFVSVKSVPGWQADRTTTKLPAPVIVGDFNLTKAVTMVTWTATGGTRIAPGEFAEFELSVGPFSDTASKVSFPTTQTYSDGEVVVWDQRQPAGAAEPEHPLPTLDLTGSESGESLVPVVADGPSHHRTVAVSAASSDSSDGTARWLGGLGLALGLTALGISVLRRRA